MRLKQMTTKEDLGVKIGSKAESRWTVVRDGARDMIIKSEMEIEINKEIKVLAEKKIEEEKTKLKS